MTLIKLGVFYLLLELNICVNSADLVETVASATNSIADYFSAQCVHFLASSSAEADHINHKLAKSISLEFKKSFGIFNWSEYSLFLDENDETQCNVPLRLTLQLSKTKNHTNFNQFGEMYANHPQKVRTGLWLIFLESFDDGFVADFFRNDYLPFDVEIMVASINGQMVSLKEVYQVDALFPKRQPFFGSWSFKTGLKSPGNSLLYLRRTDLEGLQLEVGYIDQNEPFVTGKGNSPTGYYSDIWRIIEQLINISSKFIKIPYNRARDEEKNSWLVTIKLLKKKKLDVGLANFILSPSRFNFIDFSQPLMDSKFQVFYKLSSKEDRPHIHLLPFEKEIWLAILIWAVLNSLFIYWADRLIKPRKKKTENAPDIFFDTLGGLCGQGSSNIPKFITGRILFLFTYIVAAVVIPAYSASLTRYLTAGPSGVFFKDLADFYAAGTHKMIVVEGSFEFYFFNSSYEEGYFGKIFERDLKNKKLPGSYDEALHLLCGESNIAFFTDTSTLLWELNKIENSKLRDDCSLRQMYRDTGRLMGAIVYQKNSRFKGLIDYHLRKLQSTAVLDRLKLKYWVDYQERRNSNKNSVNLEESTALLFIFISGVVFSFFLIIMEVLINNIKPSIQRPRYKKKRFRPFLFS